MPSENNLYAPGKGARHDRGPRERILTEGPRAASDADLLTAILGSGERGRRVGDMAVQLLEEGGLPFLAHATSDSLLAGPSFGPTQACRVLAAVEMGRRVWIRASAADRPIRGPEDVQERCGAYTASRKEHFFTLHLNTRHVVIREDLVSIGSLSASIVHPREVFRKAIMESAASLILVHNHPSGDPTPSDDDIRITLRLAEVGDLVGIPIVDHVVLGDDAFYSFRASKLLK
jgi:DNA repair protein RadC